MVVTFSQMWMNAEILHVKMAVLAPTRKELINAIASQDMKANTVIKVSHVNISQGIDLKSQNLYINTVKIRQVITI